MTPRPHIPDPDAPPPDRAAPSRRLGARLALAALLVAGLAGLYLVLPAPDPAAILSGFSGQPVLIVTLLILLMVAHNFIPVPAEVIALCAGGMLGLAAGIVTIWIGAMLGAALAFHLSRRFGRGLVERHADPAIIARMDRVVTDWGAPGLIVLRLIPLISFNLVNYAAGLCRIGWASFLWTTAIGILPVLVLSVAAGDRIEQVAMGPRFFAVLAAICAALVVARRLWLRRR